MGPSQGPACGAQVGLLAQEWQVTLCQQWCSHRTSSRERNKFTFFSIIHLRKNKEHNVPKIISQKIAECNKSLLLFDRGFQSAHPQVRKSFSTVATESTVYGKNNTTPSSHFYWHCFLLLLTN